ncbi:TonB-dependent receptor plug domain-containing protein, partial [Rhodopseudomonas sp. B29]|uniref:TonB-dependent receptor plug domain-containing protein n=1 Tax=Rhodopseudomonas sp. B29 TaxID=95607 RepID=UPI0004CFAFE3
LLVALSSPGLAQSATPKGTTNLPEIDVIQPKQTPHPAQRKKGRTIARARRGGAAAPRERTAEAVPQTAEQITAARHAGFDTARQAIFKPNGASAFDISHAAIVALPQAANATLDKVLLQAPGVSQDSAASGDLHVRNEHANVQYRINGIALPDGVSGFGQMLDTSMIGTMTLLTGALPAQYGLRTAGVVDITTRTDAFNN